MPAVLRIRIFIFRIVYFDPGTKESAHYWSCCGGSCRIIYYCYYYYYMCLANDGFCEAINQCSRYVEKSTKCLEQKCASSFFLNHKSCTWVWASYRPQDENIGLYLYPGCLSQFSPSPILYAIWFPYNLLKIYHSQISVNLCRCILLAHILVHPLVIYNLCTESPWNKRILFIYLFIYLNQL